ncbi:hypothetical protein MBOU_54660 [Mycobacterium bourgelatii]|uniref:Uncharacterized protein n=1 Tax=Mycobacterium bourgelatii TaxID=1273442 RepID=A0A7I9YXI3_MYCBU|nr:hypothetical protein MBOU_54660 [Mycobacterium bourgelatii]
MDLEPHQAGALSERLGRAEQPGGLLTVDIFGQVGKALEDAGERLANPRVHGAGQRIMGVTLRFLSVSLCDGDAGSGQ